MSMSTKQREQTVSGLRGYLRSLSNRRSSGTVTADDAHVYLTKKTNVERRLEKKAAVTFTKLRMEESGAVLA